MGAPIPTPMRDEGTTSSYAISFPSSFPLQAAARLHGLTPLTAMHEWESGIEMVEMNEMTGLGILV